MNKAELVSYLVGLHSLLDAQTKGARSIVTPELGAEYEKHWDMLKSTIRKENENEARKSDTQHKGKDRTDLPQGQSQGSGPDWPTHTETPAVFGAGSSSPKG